eukprot:6864147-Pyramimonas_sp.AAC.1
MRGVEEAPAVFPLLRGYAEDPLPKNKRSQRRAAVHGMQEGSERGGGAARRASEPEGVLEMWDGEWKG